MYYSREGLPKEGEILICKVNKIQYHSVFVDLLEYKGRTGMIHISEISPGRIRNIRDYVREGKLIVCKVLKVHKDKGYIDLSLRRVNEGQRREKISTIKLEQKAEKIIEFVANKLEFNPEEVYNQIRKQIKRNYEYLHEFFEDVVLGNQKIDKLKLDSKLAEELNKVIFERIKPPEVEIKAKIKLSIYDPKGINLIKKIFSNLYKRFDKVESSYLGGGSYQLIIKREDYKEAEKVFKSIDDFFNKQLNKSDSEFNIERVE